MAIFSMFFSLLAHSASHRNDGTFLKVIIFAFSNFSPGRFTWCLFGNPLSQWIQTYRPFWKYLSKGSIWFWIRKVGIQLVISCNLVLELESYKWIIDCLIFTHKSYMTGNGLNIFGWNMGRTSDTMSYSNTHSLTHTHARAHSRTHAQVSHDRE